MLNLPLFQFGHFRFHFVCLYGPFFVIPFHRPVEPLRLMLRLHWRRSIAMLWRKHQWIAEIFGTQLGSSEILFSSFRFRARFLRFERRHWLISLVLSHSKSRNKLLFCVLAFFLSDFSHWFRSLPSHPSISFVRSFAFVCVVLSVFDIIHNDFCGSDKSQCNHCFWPFLFDVRFQFGAYYARTEANGIDPNERIELMRFPTV